MTKILTSDKDFHQVKFKNEDELEKVVARNYTKIFGESCYYFDIKKGIRHRKGDLLTIPDGYLLRVYPEPSIAIVENELSVHDPVDHIGKHFLKYSSALTENTKYPLKTNLQQYLNENPDELKKVEALLSLTPYSNISSLFDAVIMDKDFCYIIVIDEKTDELERVVNPYAPEIIELKKFLGGDEVIYHVDDYEEIEYVSKTKSSHGLRKHRMRRLEGIDTIVCPAREDGFSEVFLGQNRWFAVRIKQSMIPKLKYLAMYEKNPVKAIRYIGKIKKNGIKLYRNTGKYEIVLEEKAIKIPKIKLPKGNSGLAPQAPRYTMKKLIDNAKTLEDIFTVD